MPLQWGIEYDDVTLDFLGYAVKGTGQGRYHINIRYKNPAGKEVTARRQFVKIADARHQRDFDFAPVGLKVTEAWTTDKSDPPDPEFVSKMRVKLPDEIVSVSFEAVK
jgi:hypothetical protein